MAAHRAWFCPDVVKELASYLPVADVFSLMGCGNKRIIKLLLDEAEHCLVITTRDMDRICPFLTLFKNIRYVFLSKVTVISAMLVNILGSHLTLHRVVCM